MGHILQLLNSINKAHQSLLRKRIAISKNKCQPYQIKVLKTLRKHLNTFIIKILAIQERKVQTRDLPHLLEGLIKLGNTINRHKRTIVEMEPKIFESMHLNQSVREAYNAFICQVRAARKVQS